MNILLKLAFDGSRFHGWQSQKNASAICDCITDAIEKTIGRRVVLSGCGRTDAGVHARVYYANFKADTSIPLSRLPYALNSRLPEDICVLAAGEAGEAFDSRFSCVKKEYSYLVYNSKIKNPFYLKRVLFYPFVLDYDRIIEALPYFEGTHDFSSMRTLGSNVKTTVRTMFRVSSSRNGDLIEISLCADGSLYNMARCIVGTLLYCGVGKINPSDIADIQESGERARSGPTLPACGLYLNRVWYADDVNIP